MLATPEVFTAFYQSPIGAIKVTGNDEGILSVYFVDECESIKDVHPSLKACINQLDEYFKGLRKTFSLNLQLEGSVFQKQVWTELSKIPFGQKVSYRDIALAIGSKNSVRAVGSANGRNKIWIIIPCHRVIGSNGSLTGYAGGLWRKEWLLQHETNRMK